MLLQQHHLLHADEVAGGQPVEVHTAREVRCIELHVVDARLLDFIHQCCHFLADHVVDLQLHLRLSRDGVFDLRRRVEGVRVVLRQLVDQRLVAVDHAGRSLWFVQIIIPRVVERRVDASELVVNRVDGIGINDVRVVVVAETAPAAFVVAATDTELEDLADTVLRADVRPVEVNAVRRRLNLAREDGVAGDAVPVGAVVIHLLQQVVLEAETPVSAVVAPAAHCRTVHPDSPLHDGVLLSRCHSEHCPGYQSENRCPVSPGSMRDGGRLPISRSRPLPASCRSGT